MPNNCYGTMTITGPKDQMDKVREYLKERYSEYDGKKYNQFMRSFAPCPKELEIFVSPEQPEYGETKQQFKARLKRHKKLYGYTSWYNRQLTNWGTKRDLCDLSVQREDDVTVFLSYWTAWSPPVDGVVKLSKLHPELIIDMDWEESGMGFSGEARITGGEIELINEYDDAYFGKGIECPDCECIYGEDDEMRDAEYPELCLDCADAKREAIVKDEKSSLSSEDVAVMEGYPLSSNPVSGVDITTKTEAH